MALTKEKLEALENRLAELSATATPEELAYISKALEIVAGKTTALDIVQLADDKIAELESLKTGGLDELAEAKKAAEEDLLRQKNEAEQNLDTEKEAVLEELEADILKKLQILEAKKNEYVAVIQEERDQIAGELKTELETFEQINDIPEGSTIMAEIKKRTMVEEGALPFVFGILSRSQEYYGTGNLTTELWKEGADIGVNLLGAVAGCCPTESVLGWARPPQLYFFQGTDGTFAYKSLNAVYGANTTQYTYPHACLGAFFVKNTTDADITSSFSAGGSSYSSLGSGCLIYVVKQTEAKEGIFSEAVSTTSAGAVGAYATKTVTIPAKSTIAIVMQSSGCYQTTSNSYYVIFEQWLMKGLKTFLKTGLEFDIPMTIRAWQCPGYATPLSLWTEAE